MRATTGYQIPTLQTNGDTTVLTVVSMGNTIAKRVIVLNNEEIVKPEFRLPTVAEYAFA
jgi:hypothetical protein